MKTISSESRVTVSTIHEVAARAGVSLATVSRALNHPEKVKEETLRAVQLAASELAYIPSANARSLRKSRAELIGVAVPSLSNPFFPALLEEASIEAERFGYSVLIKVDEDPLQAAQVMERSDAVDGIVVVDNQWLIQEERRPVDFRLPVIAFDRVPSFDVLGTYQVDNTHGAYTVTKHLLSCGVKRLLHISGPSGLDVSAKRQLGFERAVMNSGVEGLEVRIIEGDFTLESGSGALAEALRGDFMPQGIFAANDLMGIGAVQTAVNAGFSVPDDVKVGGFDDLVIAEFTVPSLTTYRQPIKAIAREAVCQLLDLVSNRKVESGGDRNTVHTFEGELIVRRSTKNEG